MPDKPPYPEAPVPLPELDAPIPDALKPDGPATDKPTSAMGSRLASLAVASALFMEFIDSTALSTALPTLSKAFATDPVHLKLALTSYILALAVVAPASGWVADRFGAKRVFMWAMVVFLIGSVLCGFSQNLPQLVIFRIIQGIGGAMMTPVGRLIVVGSAPHDRLVSAMSWFTMPALVGPLVGPPLAGLILSVADWPWIFFINVPVGLLGMLAVARFVPKLNQPDPGRFDAFGFVLTAVSITLLVGAAETLGMKLIPGWAQLLALAVSIGLFAWYLRHARAVVRPVLDLTLFKYRTFRASLAGGTLVRMGIGAGPFLMPLLFQVALGWSPLQAGFVTIAQGFGALSAKSFAPWIIRTRGFRTVLIASIILMSILVALPGFFQASTPIWLIMGLLALSGFIRSTQFTASNTVAYADVPGERVSAATTLTTVLQQVGLSLGITFGGLMLHMTVGGGGPLLPERFTLPFLAIGVISLAALPVYLRLPRDAGANIGGRAIKAATPG